MSDSSLISPQELADYLGVSRAWVLRKWRAGEIPGFHLGGKLLRFRRSEVEAWLEERREGPDV